jgi:hypothetical protein
MDKKWKQQERRVAKFFGTRRTPLSGSNSQHNTESDSLHGKLYIECKYRKQLFIFDEWPLVLEKANKENKIPVLSIKTMQIKDDVILIRLKDLDRIIEERKHALLQEETTMEETVLEEEQVHG